MNFRLIILYVQFYLHKFYKKNGSLASDPDHHRGVLPRADAFQHPMSVDRAPHLLGVTGKALSEETLGDVGDDELLHGIPLFLTPLGSVPCPLDKSIITFLFVIKQ